MAVAPEGDSIADRNRSIQGGDLMASPLTLLLPVIPGTPLETLGTTLEKYTPELDAALKSIGTVVNHGAEHPERRN